MSSSVTPGIDATPGSTSRGTATSTTSNGRSGRASITGARSACSTRIDRAPVEVSSTSTSVERVRELEQPHRTAAQTRRETIGTVERAIRDEDFADACVRERDRHALTDVARSEHEHPTSRKATEVVAGHRDCRHRHRRGVTGSPVSVRTRLPTSSAWRKSAFSVARAVPWPFADLPRVAYLPEDLGLAEHGRVETRCNREEVPRGTLVEVAVEVVGQLVGTQAGVVGDEVADVGVRAVEPLGDDVDLGAVAGRQQRRPR